MITFKAIKFHLRILGILEIQTSTFLRRRIFTVFYRIFVISVFLFILIPIIWFLIFKAQKFEEFTEGVVDIITIIVSFASYWCILSEKLNLIQLMDDLNEIVARSKFSKNLI